MIATAALGLLGASCSSSSGPGPDDTTAASTGDTELPDSDGDDGVRLLLTGDVMLGRGVDQILPHSVDPVLYEGYMRSAEGYVRLAEETTGPIPRNVAPGYVWGHLLDVLETWNPTARIVNLETAVTTWDEPWPGKGIHYRMHPANVDVLTAAGVDCAVLANNHVLDWSRPGLLETLDTLQDAGIHVAGAGRDRDAAFAPAILETPTGRVLVFGLAHGSSGVPRAWAAQDDQPGLFRLPDLSRETARQLARDIQAHRRPGDRVVASIHWGGNWGCQVPAEQERFAKTLLDEGAVDLVHGHSSHHPKGLEVYRGRLILYGAGDLINDYEGIGGHESYRPELTLAYLPRLDAAGRLDSLLLAPLRVEHFQLQRATREETRWLRNLLAEESRGLRFERTEDGLILARPGEG